MTAACGAPPPKVEEMRAAAELLQWEADPKAAGLMTATGSRPESGWAGAEAAVACPRRHGKTHTNSQGVTHRAHGGLTDIPKHSKTRGVLEPSGNVPVWTAWKC